MTRPARKKSSGKPVVPGTYKAVVRNGRLRLDDPTDLPEGTVVELGEADPYAYLDHINDMDDRERERLHASIDRGLEQARDGKGRPAEEVIADLRRRG